MSTHIADTLGALSDSSSDYTQWVNKDGFPLAYPYRSFRWRATTAISVGQCCIWVAPTTTAPLSVTFAATGSSPGIFAGLAKTSSAAAGDMVEIVDYGFGLALVEGSPTSAAALGSRAQRGGTTAGSFDSVAAAGAATDILGAFLGSFLGAKVTSYLGSANYAPLFVNQT